MSQDDQDLLSEARTRLRIASDAYSDSRTDELSDLQFASGSPDNNFQWPQNVLGIRGAISGQSVDARPCLTINKLPQHIRQITNDQRQNRPAGKTIPVNDGGAVEVAKVYDGIVRHIEYISNADVAYDTACENQVTYGEGYVRLLTEYLDETTFDQEIKIGRIRNSFSVYMDPMIQDPCGEDAQWCFITQDLTKEEYERMFPDAKSMASLSLQSVGDESMGDWVSEETIRIAEYFYAEYTKKKLHMYPGGITSLEGTEEDDLNRLMAKPTQTREVDVKKIQWCKINGFEILEKREWPGNYIPVIRVVGNEFEIEGKLYLSGIVRNAKDAQRMYNYWASQEAEMLALAPKAPFIGYGGQFEGYEHQWKTANTQNWPYLEVNADVMDGNGQILPLPQRAQPPMAQVGLIQAKMGASDDIKATTGQYDSSLGATSNERSGKAILARERQGDTGTYHYIDNLSRAVRYTTRQIIDLIPKIYDTKRIARIIGEDGESEMVQLDPDQKEAYREVRNEQDVVIKKIYNPAVGKYDVRVTTGPSYMTKRQEQKDSMTAVAQVYPQMLEVAGDEFIASMDWAGAQKIAERIRRTIPPQVLGTGDKNPELQMANQKIQQMGQEMDQLHEMLQGVTHSIEVQEQDRKEFEAQIKAYDAETKRMGQLQDSMSPEQIQQIVIGTVNGMISSGDLAVKSAQLNQPIAAMQGEQNGTT